MFVLVSLCCADEVLMLNDLLHVLVTFSLSEYTRIISCLFLPRILLWFIISLSHYDLKCNKFSFNHIFVFYFFLYFILRCSFCNYNYTASK
jgi:hypothetical protein